MIEIVIGPKVKKNYFKMIKIVGLSTSMGSCLDEKTKIKMNIGKNCALIFSEFYWQKNLTCSFCDSEKFP